MNRWIELAVVAALASGLYASAARADLLDWSYTYNDGTVLSGVFTGTDAGNYFTVTGLQSSDVNGVAASYLTGGLIESLDSAVGAGQGHNGNGTAVVTLDGSYLDLYNTTDQANGFEFFVGDAYAQVHGPNYTAYDIPSSGFVGNAYVQALWSATLVGTPVPEPSTAAIVVTGVLGLGIVRIRKIV